MDKRDLRTVDGFKTITVGDDRMPGPVIDFAEMSGRVPVDRELDRNFGVKVGVYDAFAERKIVQTALAVRISCPVPERVCVGITETLAHHSGHGIRLGARTCRRIIAAERNADIVGKVPYRLSLGLGSRQHGIELHVGPIVHSADRRKSLVRSGNPADEFGRRHLRRREREIAHHLRRRRRGTPAGRIVRRIIVEAHAAAGGLLAPLRLYQRFYTDIGNR